MFKDISFHLVISFTHIRYVVIYLLFLFNYSYISITIERPNLDKYTYGVLVKYWSLINSIIQLSFLICFVNNGLVETSIFLFFYG